MSFKVWLSSAVRLLKSATKPDSSEFLLLFRVCLLGAVVLGAVGFVIRFVFALLGLAST